jgi:hypothetical protein
VKHKVYAEVHRYDETPAQDLEEALAETLEQNAPEQSDHEQTPPPPTQSETDDEKPDPFNEEIRNSPIHPTPTLPKTIIGQGGTENFHITTQATLKVMTTQTTTTTLTQEDPTRAKVIAKAKTDPDKVRQAFKKGMNRGPPGGDPPPDQGGGGGPGNPGRGGPGNPGGGGPGDPGGGGPGPAGGGAHPDPDQPG